MSRKLRRGRRDKAPNGKWTVTGNGVEFLRGRDPEVMYRLMQKLMPRKAVLSWLTPGKPLFGLPRHLDGSPWLTIVDDIDPVAAGPESFDKDSLKGWAIRAQVIAVDAAAPKVKVYETLGSLAADGRLVLVVQTVEARRLQWHQYFVFVRPPGTPTMMMHHLNNPRSDGPRQIVRMGGLHDDFESDRPILPSSASASNQPLIIGATARRKLS